jgi:hypothetical protein
LKIVVRCVLGLVSVLTVCAFLALSAMTADGALGVPADFTPTAYVYLPLMQRGQYTCPVASGNSYAYGVAFQHDLDNPVRPAHLHADKNLALRSYSPTDPPLRELVAYGTEDPQPPQFATLFQPYRVPPLVGFYRVYDWIWADPPDPGTRGGLITDYPVTALGLQTTPGEVLHVPESGYNIGGDPEMEVLVLFADEDSISLHYGREDSAALGYTVHVDNICTDPNLLALYNALDDPDGPRYEYPVASYNLPNLPAGKSFGTARGTEVVVAIVDSGGFMDPRSCNEWWQIRPGYAGSCPPHE